MKILDKLIIKSFIGPLIMTFFIVLFVLDMQFLWKYVDDLVGKGLEWYVIAELLVYASASLVPMALPLAVLLSSLMAFGNLGENYELVSCKAAGISLQRVMLSLMISVFLISIGAFLFSNYVMPYANLKFASLLFDVRKQRPAFYIKEGVFYNGMDGYSIRIGKKYPDGSKLGSIMIYDHTSSKKNSKVIVADSGIMKTTPDERFMNLTLYKGIQYEELNEKDEKNKMFPHVRMEFEEYHISFNMSAFQMKRTDESLFKDHYQMLNLSQLNKAIDTLKMDLFETEREENNRIISFLNIHDTLSCKLNENLSASFDSNFIDRFKINDQSEILQRSSKNTRDVKSVIVRSITQSENKNKYIIKHEVEWHRKFTLATACFVLFFIGAPLGAIIRVGGLGLPVVISILFFVFFYVISITGEKFAKEGMISSAQGMWIAIMVLLPIGVFLTRQATMESSFLDWNNYASGLRKLFFIDKIEKFFSK